MATTASPSGLAQIERTLGAEAEPLLTHVCETIGRDRLYLPGSDFVDRVYAQSDRRVPVLRSLQQMFDHGRLGGTGYLSILPGRPGHRALGRRLVRPEPRLLRSRAHRRAGDRGRLQRRREHARRARRRLAPLRAPDPVHRQAEPQRVPQLPERLRPDQVRIGQAGGRARRRRGRRHDLLRLRGVAPADRRGLRDVPGGARGRPRDDPLVLPAQRRVQLEGRRPRVHARRRPHGPGEPPRRHDRGRHHQAEGARDGRAGLPRPQVRQDRQAGLLAS